MRLKTIAIFTIAVTFLFFYAGAFCQQADSKPKDADQPENQKVTGDLEVQGSLKADKEICIGSECKKSWPCLKCKDYQARPQGESGDDYCNSIGQTCFSVSIGSGASYFGECSTPPASEHKTRCCWVE